MSAKNAAESATISRRQPPAPPGYIAHDLGAFLNETRKLPRELEKPELSKAIFTGCRTAFDWHLQPNSNRSSRFT